MFGAIINLNISDEEAGKIVIDKMFNVFRAINPLAWEGWTSLRLYNSIKHHSPMTPALLGSTAKRNKVELSQMTDIVNRAREKYGLRWDKYGTYVNGFEKAMLDLKNTVKFDLPDLPIFASPAPTWKKYLPVLLIGGILIGMTANQKGKLT